MSMNAVEMTSAETAIRRAFPGGFPCTPCLAVGRKGPFAFSMNGPFIFAGPDFMAGGIGVVTLTCSGCGYIMPFSADRLGINPR